MLKLDFGSDDFQNVDLSGNNNGFSKMNIMNDMTRSSNSPNIFKSSGTPNLDVSNKDSDLGLQLLMNNRELGRNSPNSPKPSSSMTPQSLNLGSTSPSNQQRHSGNSSLFMGGNKGIDRSTNNSPSKVDFTPGKLDLDSKDLDIDLGDLDMSEPSSLKPNFNILGDNSGSGNSSQESSGNDLFSSFKPGNTFDSGTTTTSDQTPIRKTFEQIQKEKADMLRKLDRLRKKGYFVYRNFDMNSEYEDIKNEYENVKEEASLQRSLRQQKDILITTSRVIEGVASNELVQEYTGKLELEGWSQHMMETVDDYEEIMEDLHDKYGKMFADGAYPEARLLFAVIHSAIMFHITKKYVQQMPNLGNLLNQNPHLAREFSKATANFVGQQSPAFASMANDMNMANGGGNMEPRDMQGPKDIDNILNRLKNGSDMDERGFGMNL